MPQWYAIHTKPRQEKKALTHLARQGFECHLAMARERRLVRGRYTQVTVPLFPNYLFAHLSMGDDNVAPIRSTQGVIGFTRFGLHIPPLPEGFVESLQAHDPDACGIPIGATDWQPGQKLRVTDGPFAGLEAVFAARDGAERVFVLLNMLGGEQRLAIPEHHLRLSAFIAGLGLSLYPSIDGPILATGRLLGSLY